MREAESGRGKRSPTSDFLSVVMKWPFIQDGPGSPVSPDSNRMVVGPSAPWLPKGTIRTESTRSLRLRESSDTIKTQWRTGGFSRIAGQISPRRGEALWLVKVHLLRYSAQGVFEIGLFRGGFGGQAFEVTGGLTLQRSAVVQPAGRFHCLVHCLSDAFGPARPHPFGPARLHHIVKVSIIVRADYGGQFLALRHVSYFRR